MEYPTKLVEQLTFLKPGTGLGERADEALLDLQAHGFVAATGITEYTAGAIGQMSREPHIEEWCPDRKKRHGNLKMSRTWHGKGGGRGTVGIFDVPELGGAPIDLATLEEIGDEDVVQAAYGWSGYEENKVIPGADVTTAFRAGRMGLELARQRRTPGERFGLGKHLVELTLGTAVNIYGANPEEISLEVWKANDRARALYEEVGFDFVTEKDDARPTLHEVGDVINDNTVYVDLADGQRKVADTRMYYVLGDRHPLNQAA